VRIGEIEVVPILDAEGTFATVDEVFSPVEAALKADAARRFPANFRGDEWWLPIQVALIRTRAATVLIDAGLGPSPRRFMPKAPAYLLEQLGALGLVPEAVDLVIHTHLHVDHVGWNGSFPNARHIIHEKDLAYFSTPQSLSTRPHLHEKVLALRDSGRLDLIDAAAEPITGVKIVPTPGHTPGHISVRVESDDRAFLVLGDIVVHPLQLLDPDIRSTSDHDQEHAARTRRSVLDGLADDGIPVLNSHLHGVGRLVHAGKGWDWMSRE
jgi:glyoxylase-like metal-dependent hydrolase (beta-lactamase superfamily II)